MRHFAAFLIAAASFATAACEPTVQLPVRAEIVAVSVSVDELVCHVRAIAKEQRLSFHYGTFTVQTGRKATIRLIGEAFELEMARWDARPQYEIRAYDMSKDGSARQIANRSFDQFKTTLIERLTGKCAR